MTATAGGPTGSAAIGLIRIVPSLLEIWTTTPHLVPGSSYTVRFRGPPNTALALLGNLRLERLVVPPLARPLWLATQPSPLLFGVAVTDALGSAAVTPTIPNLPSAVGRLWLQGLSVAGPTLELSPVVGGQVF